MSASAFDSEFQAAAWPDLRDLLGQSVVYTPAAGDPSTIVAVWQEQQFLPGYYVDGRQTARTGTLMAEPGDVPDPAEGEIFTIGGETWAIKGIGRRQPVTELQLERREQVAVGGGERRIQR